MLLIPASYISNAEKSKTENRYLAKQPQFFTKRHKINLNYGKEFNDWFNDRFTLRDKLIKVNALISYYLGGEIYKNNKITFYKKYNFMDSGTAFGSGMEITPEILETYYENVSKFQKYCDDNNIKLYILVVPRQIEFFDFRIKNERRNKPDLVEEALS